jgi:hypothetical protein
MYISFLHNGNNQRRSDTSLHDLPHNDKMDLRLYLRGTNHNLKKKQNIEPGLMQHNIWVTIGLVGLLILVFINIIINYGLMFINDLREPQYFPWSILTIFSVTVTVSVAVL